MTTAILTADLDDRFFTDLRAVGRDVGADPLDLLMMMYAESGVHANAYNPNGGGDCVFEEGRKLSRHRFPSDAEVRRIEGEHW